MIQEKEINIDNIIDNHYDNIPMVDTNEDSEDVYNNVPEHLEYLSFDRIKELKELFKGKF